MRGDIEVTVGKDGIKNKLRYYPTDFYAVDSEVNQWITYLERDGEIAICYGKTAIRMKKAVWQELAQILNERNLTKYGVEP